MGSIAGGGRYGEEVLNQVGGKSGGEHYGRKSACSAGGAEWKRRLNMLLLMSMPASGEVPLSYSLL